MENIINKKVFELSRLGEIIQTTLIIISALLIPAFVPFLLQLIFGETSFIATHSQFIVGSIVNTALIITGLNIKGWKNILSISILPSVSAISSGYIFGSLTKVTVFMIPGIWLGNLALILLIKYLYAHKNINYILSASISILAKVGIIFGTLNIWMAANILPNQGAVATALRTTMGTTQLITATIGAIISFSIIKLTIKNRKG